MIWRSLSVNRNQSKSCVADPRNSVAGQSTQLGPPRVLIPGATLTSGAEDPQVRECLFLVLLLAISARQMDRVRSVRFMALQLSEVVTARLRRQRISAVSVSGAAAAAAHVVQLALVEAVAGLTSLPFRAMEEADLAPDQGVEGEAGHRVDLEVPEALVAAEAMAAVTLLMVGVQAAQGA